MANYFIAHLDEVPPVRCPCGFARRAFADAPGSVASLHVVEIEHDSRVHYHKKMTEIYLVLEGEGQMELDGELIPVKPMTAIYIQPDCHRLQPVQSNHSSVSSNAGMGMFTRRSRPIAR